MTNKEKIEGLLLKVKNPSRYIGGELNSVIKDKSRVDVRFAFCFPDTYDIGMSHLGMKILYSLKNSRENFWCERVFSPAPDFEALMRENGLLLYGLESLDPINEFDFVGFTLQYEMCYTTVLNMLDLGGIPVYARDRDEGYPLVMAGGPCVCNPEPMAEFFDFFVLGEGEEVNLEIMDIYCDMKKNGSYSKKAYLERIAHVEGIYVPSFYDVRYNDDGTVKEYTPINENAPATVKKRIVADMDKAFYPEKFVVPFSEIVHDRAVVEVLRGCIRGCRFCQAGFIYRPFREKSAENICQSTKALCESTGYEEVSLSSLSTSDHADIDNILERLTEYTEGEHINLALPSMRIDRFSGDIMEQLQKVRKSGLTFAPEAGTQRLRDVINKNITEENVLSACKLAFSGGYTQVKLYFMLGLPEETDEDIVGIVRLADRIADLFYANPDRPRGKNGRLTISVSCATFIPKPFTPFEFEPRISDDEIRRRQGILMGAAKGKKYLNISCHHSDVSTLEAVLARGDRRLCDVIYSAWKKGCKLDGWDEYFRYDMWQEAFLENGADMDFYACRTRSYDEVMPWDHLDYLVSKKFLIRENKRAHDAQTTKSCREQCAGCGVNLGTGRECFG